MNSYKINLIYVSFIFMIILQGCYERKPIAYEYPRYLANSTPVRTTSGLVHDWMTDYGPFSPRTIIEYYVADSSVVLLLLKNSVGKVVDTLVNKLHKPGLYEASTSTSTSGLFMWELRIGDYVEKKQLILLKKDGN